MKLAICHPVVEPTRGGCETYLAMLLHRLCKDGHHVHLLASRWDAASLPERLVVHPLPDCSQPRFLRPWRFNRAVRRELAKDRYDLSLGFDKVAGVDVLYPQGGLYAATVDGGFNRHPAAWRRAAAGLLRSLDPAYLSMCWQERHQYLDEPRPFVLAISEMTRGHLVHYLGIRPDDAAVVRAAIDPDRLVATDRPARRDSVRQKWGIQPDDVLGLFVGVNPRLKGVEPLLHAVARLKDVPRFLLGLVGFEPAGPYERLARRLGISDKVRFMGYQRPVRDVYFASDFLVHPTFYDPCSLVVLEAIAVGLPVVTTRYNGASELLDPPADSRVIADPHDHAALAEAMRAFLDHDARRAASKAAARSAARWTFDDHYRELTRLLEVALRRKRAA